MRLFDMARLCEYRGGRPFYRLAIPSLFRLGCLGLIACVLCVASRPFLMPLSVPTASRSPLRPIRYDKRGGGYWSSRCLLDGASDGAGGLVSSWLSCVRCGCLPHARLGSPAVPPFHIAAACPFPHGVAARPFPSCPPPCRSFVSPPLPSSVLSWCRRSPALVMLAIHHRPVHRHERRGAGRGGCLLGVADRMMCVGLKKAGGVFVPRPLASALSAV